MFQYAFGCRIEAESKHSVKFDVSSSFRNDPYGRAPSLHLFKTRVEAARGSEIPRGMKWRSPWHRVAKLAWRAMPRPLQSVAYERRPFNFDHELLSANGGPAYYFGYWQSPDYFSSLRQKLVQDFSLNASYSPPFAALVKEMQQQRSISVHVRLCHGLSQDGTPVSGAPAWHGTCPDAYFEQAVSRIGVTSDTIAYVFSDDPGLAKSRLRLPLPCRYVADLCPCSDAEELLLMAACQHHVISNSTFSWWGAWLGGNLEKIVVAPSRWMAGMSPEQVRICPKEWIRI